MFRLALKVGMVVLMEYLNSGVHADEKQQIVVLTFYINCESYSYYVLFETKHVSFKKLFFLKAIKDIKRIHVTVQLGSYTSFHLI